MTRSERFFEDARQFIPGGVNSPVRAFTSVGGTPYFVARAAGARVWDVEGTEYLDHVQSYGATIGGMATPVGTPPNLVFMEVWKTNWPDRPPIGFGQWMAFGIPYMVVFLAIAWLLLTRIVFRVPRERLVQPSRVRERILALGRTSRDERLAGLVFAITALLWITGDGIRFTETLELSGWRAWSGLGAVTDGAVAIAAAITLFLIPSTEREGVRTSHRALMTWDFAEKHVPWGVLLLFGGGFAIASGMERSGLAQSMVAALSGHGDAHPAALVAAVGSLVCLMSELGSNTATASLTLPILAESASVWGMDPLWLLIPATLAATLGFALPVASPMQAIVFGSGRIPVRQMVRAGIWMDVIGVVLLVLFFGLG